MSSPVYALHKSEEDFQKRAIGFGQRRALLVSGMLGGFAIGGAGMGWLFGAAALGQPLESGLIMVGVGLIMAGIGWLATAGVRFTRRLPKPTTNRQNIARSTRNGVAGGWVTVILVLIGVLAVFLFAPRGKEADVLAIFPMVIAIPTVMLIGFYRVRHIMRNRNELYTAWLQKHHSDDW